MKRVGSVFVITTWQYWIDTTRRT